MTKTFEEIWKEATEETDLKFKNQDTLSWVVFMKEEPKSRIVPIIQQQALPVVKDFVVEWYQEHKDDLDFSIFEACVSLYDDNSNDFKKWFGNSENKSIETLIRMKDGYTVEKPQLFYLKNKLTERALYYQKIDGKKVFNETHFDNRGRYSTFITKFTQQEIDSMQTGSYEKIEVAE